MPWRHIGGPEVQLHSFLASTPVVTFLIWLLYHQKITLVPTEKEAEGLQSRAGWFLNTENLFPLPGFEPQTVQPVADCYTNYINPAFEVTK
jgi:hypothetical protein